MAMIKHSMDVVKSAVEHLNTGQAPVLTFDQPLFALAKQIQWKWPEKYGEEKPNGGLHISRWQLYPDGWNGVLAVPNPVVFEEQLHECLT